MPWLRINESRACPSKSLSDIFLTNMSGNRTRHRQRTLRIINSLLISGSWLGYTSRSLPCINSEFSCPRLQSFQLRTMAPCISRRQMNHVKCAYVTAKKLTTSVIYESTTILHHLSALGLAHSAGTSGHDGACDVDGLCLGALVSMNLQYTKVRMGTYEWLGRDGLRGDGVVCPCLWPYVSELKDRYLRIWVNEKKRTTERVGAVTVTGARAVTPLYTVAVEVTVLVMFATARHNQYS